MAKLDIFTNLITDGMKIANEKDEDEIQEEVIDSVDSLLSDFSSQYIEDNE
jgi:hypothetical protein